MKFIPQAIILCAIGLLSIIGDITGYIPLKVIGKATNVSPAMQVFTTHKGFETFSSHFFINWTDSDGNEHQLAMTPEVYRKLKGPYNRRNVYGAAFSYAPVLWENKATRPMLNNILHQAICRPHNILSELDVTNIDNKKSITIKLSPRIIYDDSQSWKLAYEVNCHA